MRKPVFLVSAILILLQGCHGAQPRDQLINHTAAPDSQEVYFEKTEPLSEQEVISRVDEQYEQYDHVGLRMSRPTGQQDYYVDVEDMSKIDDDDGEKIVVLQYTNKKDASDFGYIWFPLSEQNDSIPGRITVNDGKIPDDIDPEDEYFLNPDFYIDPSAPSFTFINNEQDGTINISGQRVDQYGNTSDIAFTFDPSLANFGTSTITVNENKREASLTGTLGAKTYRQIEQVADKIDTLYLVDVPGSINDEVNMHTGSLIRDHKITTVVPKGSLVASGGVDLFSAGFKRRLQKGGQLHVHSWCGTDEDGDNVIQAGSLPRDDKEHWAQLTYFDKMLGKKDGPAFYFYTIYSAKCENTHLMSTDEVLKYHLATEIFE